MNIAWAMGFIMERLIKIAEGTGCSVKFSKLSALGRCDYQNKVIYISEDEEPRKKVMILAHEVGHWLSYLDHKKNTSLRRNDREKLAYTYGWRLLANTGLSREYSITKEEWKDLNFINYTNFDADNKEAWK